MGKAIPLDQALKEVVSGIQGRLNDLECVLQRAADEEAKLDQNFTEEEDEANFRRRVTLEDNTQDLVAGLVELAEELPDVAADIRGAAPSKETRAWFSLHKKERKLELARRKEAAKQRAAEERAAELAAKEARALEPSAGPR